MPFLCEIDETEEFNDDDYDPGMMFAYWFENLIAETGWRNLNFETQEITRCYWDLYHEKKRRRYDERKEVGLCLHQHKLKRLS